MTNPPTTPEGQPGERPPVPEDLLAQLGHYFSTVTDEQIGEALKKADFDFYNRIGRIIDVPPTPPTAAALAEELAKTILASQWVQSLYPSGASQNGITTILTPALAKLVGEANSIAIPEDGVPPDKWLRVGVHQIIEMRDSLALARAERDAAVKRADSRLEEIERWMNEYTKEASKAVRLDAEAADLREKLERAEGNQRRYQYLRSNPPVRLAVYLEKKTSDGLRLVYHDGPELDSAIDAAQSTLTAAQEKPKQEKE